MQGSFLRLLLLLVMNIFKAQSRRDKKDEKEGNFL
jgi:hypothetical protein